MKWWPLLGAAAFGWWYWRRERRIADGVLRGYASDFVVRSEDPAYEEATRLSWESGLPPGWVVELWHRGLRGEALRAAVWRLSDLLERALATQPVLTREGLVELKVRLLGEVPTCQP